MLHLVLEERYLEHRMQAVVVPALEKLSVILPRSVEYAPLEEVPVRHLLHLYRKDVPLVVPARQVQYRLLAIDGLGRLFPVEILHYVRHPHILRQDHVEQCYQQRLVVPVRIHRLPMKPRVEQIT